MQVVFYNKLSWFGSELPEKDISNVVVYTRKNLTTCNKSADKPSTRCVRTACSKVVNKMFQTC